MKFAVVIILLLAVGAFLLFNQGNDSSDASSSIPSDSEFGPEISDKLEDPNHSTNSGPVETEHIGETGERNKLIADSTIQPTAIEIDRNEVTSYSHRYIRLARKALGDEFIPPPDVNPVVTQGEGVVVVTYPVEPLTKNGVPIPSADFHVRVKFDAHTNEVVSIQVGS